MAAAVAAATLACGTADARVATIPDTALPHPERLTVTLGRQTVRATLRSACLRDPYYGSTSATIRCRRYPAARPHDRIVLRQSQELRLELGAYADWTTAQLARRAGRHRRSIGRRVYGGYSGDGPQHLVFSLPRGRKALRANRVIVRVRYGEDAGHARFVFAIRERGRALRRRPYPARGFRHAGTGTAAPVGDGRRYVAFLRRPGEVEVIDDARGTTFRHEVPEGCVPVAVGAGDLLLGCHPVPPVGFDETAHGMILHLATQELIRAPEVTIESGAQGEQPAYTGIGSHWLDLDVTGYHLAYQLYVDRATGARVERSTQERPELLADLDEPGLWRELCEPVRLSPWDGMYDADGPFAPMTYEPPYALTFGSGRHARDLVLERCGHARPVPLAPRCRPCGEQFGAGLVTWVRGSFRHSRVHTYDVRRHRRGRIAIHDPAAPVVLHTRRGIFVALSHGLGDAVRIYRRTR